jgi:aspartate kinase
MIVIKFGGTSLEDATAIERAIAIVKTRLPQQPLVVASAMAKITDTLIECARLAQMDHESQALALVTDALAHRHHMVISQLITHSWSRMLLQDALEKYIEEIKTFVHGLAILGELSPRSLAMIASYGERLSTLILTAAMQERSISAELLDARRLIITNGNFTKATPLMDVCTARARELVLPLVKKGVVPVTQGFIGATADGVTTILSRGGSDYSAAILGAALDAEVVEIWTDVDGMLSADPKLVPHARLLKRVTFQEASELAYFGAKVLHPSTLLPAIEKNIPIHIYNSRRPEAPGTHIVAHEPQRAQHGVVKSIAYKKGITMINVYSTRMLMAHGFLKAIFDVFDRFETSVDLVTTSEVNVSLTIDDTRHLDEIVNELQRFATVTVERGKAIICVVGEAIKHTPGIATHVFGAIRDINVNMISQGASEINISVIVNESDVPTAIQKLHREFFEEPQGGASCASD